MAERLHPDVYVEEIGGRPVLLGVGTGTGCLIGTCPKGPTDKAIFIASYSQFVSRFGADGGYLDEAVKAFFNNGGSRTYIIRVLASDAVKADASVGDMDVTAKYFGTYANTMSVNTVRYTCLIATSDDLVSATSYEVDLIDASNVEVGDIIYFWSGSVWVPVVVADIAGNKIYFPPVTFAGTINGVTTATYPGICCTEHRLSTRVAAALISGTAYTTITLNSIGALRVGDYVKIVYYDSVGLTAYEWGRTITSINGNDVSFVGAITPALNMQPFVVTEEFSVFLYDQGVALEVISGLSASGTSTRYYVARVSGDTNLSANVELSYTGGGTSVGDNIPFNILPPYVAADTSILGGTDGSTPTTGDYQGSEVAPKSDRGLMEDIRDVQMLAIPGITAEAVILDAVGYCERRGTVTFLMHGPDTAETPQEIKQWRQLDVNVDSSYAAMYYPWLNVDDGLGGLKLVPPVGAVMGMWANVAGRLNISVAPANTPLAEVLSLQYSVSDSEHDILNPVGINVIREFIGRGIRVWGARTLTSLRDGRHYLNVRGLLNFVKQTVFEGTQWAVFKPNDPRLWLQISSTVSGFLKGLWLQGMLFPSNDESKAFYVKCDAETNPVELTAQGIVTCEVGVNPPFPAEFVVFKIGVWDGGGSVSENV